MKKIYLKLVATTLILLLSITAVVSASYAWFVLSENPAVSGIQVSLSGGNTILIAANESYTENGVTYHYPGKFSESLNFAGYPSYNYLKNLGGLSPVSTADGVNWFIATYYTEDDELVQNGVASVGQLKPVRDFFNDDRLAYANQEKEADNLKTGHYVYLDFWVVAPGADYTLRICTGNDGGSYVIDLLDSEQTADGYQLNNTGVTSTAACVRIGFLTSAQKVTDNSIAYYRQSASYDNRFTSLKGVYAESGERGTTDQTQFMIYEPNADAHPTGKVTAGSLAATYPIGLVGGVPTPTSVRYKTALQLTNWWKAAANGDLLIEQMFQTALLGKHVQGEDSLPLYSEYLQGQLHPYIDQGKFISNGYLLGDTVSAERLQSVPKGTAAEDVFIVELERNIPQRIRMFIWLEGQDPDWDPTAAGESFAMRLEFAGGTD